MNRVYVVGHRNPDTDSIASAVGYAELKRRTGMPEAVAMRLGDLWPETAYLLERFGVECPELLHDVYPRVRDVMNQHPDRLRVDATVRDAGPVMRHRRVVPVVDAGDRYVGVLTLNDIAARYLEEMDLAGGAASRIAYSSIVRTLDGTLLCGGADGEWQGRVWVAAMQAYTMARLMSPGDLLVVGDRADAQTAALEAGAACLVLVGGCQPDTALLELARDRGARIISTPHDSYRVTRLLNLSTPVAGVLRRDHPTAEPDDLTSEVDELLSDHGVRALPVLDENQRLLGIVTMSDVLHLRGRGVILVDHNHSSQAVPGLEQATLLEVIDHHNLGDLHTVEPIYMKLEPVGSTSTIVAEMYRAAGETPAPATAGVLAGGIVSDTLLFRSPTCTPRDRAAAEWLAELTGVDLDELAHSMFQANSNYANTSPEQLLAANLKVYDWGGQKVGIGQAETVDMAYFRRNSEAVLQALRTRKQSDGLNYIYFLATDILTENSVLFLESEQERTLAERVFGGRADGCLLELPGVVSRKKQVVPPLARELG